ncbi:MAG: dehydrogenase [Deltaproteobacteria bacterium]|nr:dehydrogenase [Deltaproteobacteria bacterium]
MARVFNHQLGRVMSYWFPEHRPERQFAAVFDTNKCIACQTCSLACKTTWTSGRGQEYMLWNNVETKPYGFYPIGWDARLLEALGPQAWKDGVYEGRTIFEAAPAGERLLGFAPEELDYAHPNIGEDESAAAVDKGAHLVAGHANAWMFYAARICNHCTFPACLASCPRGSIYKRREDGIVLIDQGRCRGYQECVRGCPYKKTFFNPVTRTSEKCIACFPKIERGLQPQCFVNCIGKIRSQGWVSTPEAAREDNPIDYLVHVRKVALPLYPQFGLEPNVYYVPPVHVPAPFLLQMFGPGARAAIATYRSAAHDRTLAGLFTLFGCTQSTIARFAVRDDTAIAWGDDGEELVRVPLREPVTIRAPWDESLAVPRWNIP